MAETKIFRVFIGEQQTFHVDAEATSADEAMGKVIERLLYPDGDVLFVDDNTAYEGCKVERAIEIKREDAHLDAWLPRRMWA